MGKHHVQLSARNSVVIQRYDDFGREVLDDNFNPLPPIKMTKFEFKNVTTSRPKGGPKVFRDVRRESSEAVPMAKILWRLFR